MAGYIIADVEITDAELFAEYQKLVPQTIELFGGRYLARGGDSQVLEGQFSPNRTVIIEFDSMERAREWHDSPEYAPAKEIRFKSANTKVLIVEGV